MEKRRESYGWKKGEGYEWGKWGWLWVGKRGRVTPLHGHALYINGLIR